jgi:hypothetical protein
VIGESYKTWFPIPFWQSWKHRLPVKVKVLARWRGNGKRSVLVEHDGFKWVRPFRGMRRDDSDTKAM